MTVTDAATGTITISGPLNGAASNQSYTFTRFAYLLDFTGFNFLSNFELKAVALNSAGVASCLALPIDGFALRLTDCWFTEPKDRGVTSCGNGDFALTVERCEFASSE